jgi:hypothetical protein
MKARFFLGQLLLRRVLFVVVGRNHLLIWSLRRESKFVKDSEMPRGGGLRTKASTCRNQYSSLPFQIRDLKN